MSVPSDEVSGCPAPVPAVPSEAPGERRLVVVAPDDASGRLDKTLAAEAAELSRSRLQALIAEGRVTSDGRTIDDPSYRVKPGQRFEILIPPAEPAVPEPQAIALDVVYEDRDLLVVDKPAGMVVHPAAGNPDRTLVNALLAHCGAGLSGIGGVVRPGIVHRLDKDTSGLMVVAKNDAAHAALSAQFADRTLSRTYLAVTRGTPPRTGEVNAPIGRSPRDRKKMAVVERGGKPALTRYRVLRPLGPGAALVECELATGRTHQIRVHMASIGHPLVGDPLYGGPVRGKDPWIAAMKRFPRQALHAAKLRFRHPADGREMRFDSPLPADLRDLIGALAPEQGSIP